MESQFEAARRIAVCFGDGELALKVADLAETSSAHPKKIAIGASTKRNPCSRASSRAFPNLDIEQVLGIPDYFVFQRLRTKGLRRSMADYFVPAIYSRIRLHKK